MERGQKKKKFKDKKTIRKGESAADLLPDEVKGPRPVELTPIDLDQILKLAELGMPNDQIAHIMNFNPRTFARRVAADKLLFEEEKDDEDNLFVTLEKGKSTAAAMIYQTAYDMVTKERSVPMTIFLLKTRYGHREKVEVEANVTNTVVFETQLAGGVIRTNSTTMSAGELAKLDAMIIDVTEEQCPSNESDLD